MCVEAHLCFKILINEILYGRRSDVIGERAAIRSDDDVDGGVGWGWCSVVEFQGCATLVEAVYQGRQTVQPATPRNLATALAKIRDREIEN